MTISLAEVLTDQLNSFRLLPSHSIVRRIEFSPYISTPEILLITGVRRCGKSFALKQCAKLTGKMQYVFYLNLDDPRLSTFAADDIQNVYEIWLSCCPDLRCFQFGVHMRYPDKPL